MKQRKKNLATTSPSLLLDILFLNGVLITGMASTFFIFQDGWFFLSATVALALGNFLAWLSILNRWPWWITFLAAYFSYLFAGVLVGSPGIYAGDTNIIGRLVTVIAMPITGWKQLLTLELPVGTYQSTQAVVMLVGIVCSLTCFLVAWQAKRLWAFAPACAIGILGFGIMFGPTVTTSFIGGEGSWISWQMIIGALAIVLSSTWAALRVRSHYVASLRATTHKAASGSGHGQATGLRLIMGGTMMVVAAAISIFLSPLTLTSHARDVLRSGVSPQQHVQTANTPLATYRDYFGGDLYDAALFTIQDTKDVDRVRLATLRYYNGVNATVTPEEDEITTEGTFVRVPSQLRPKGRGDIQANIVLDAYGGPWLPMVGLLDDVNFEGPNREALSDGFYYDRENVTAIETADEAMQKGVAYSVSAQKYLVPSSEISSFRPGNQPDRFGVNFIPESLSHWVTMQNFSNDGAGLQELVSRLRARGYLSHALLEPDSDGVTWTTQIEDYAFVPSRAGHSYGRIEGMFDALVEREEELPDGADENLLVSAIGDDEQFAVSVALIASKLGFNSRVVLGAVLNGDANGLGCAQGACRGKDMRAWVEVQDGPTGQWAALDVTPQTEMHPDPEITQHADPKNATEVLPKLARVVPPPAPNPEEWEGETSAESHDKAESGQITQIGRWIVVGLLGGFVVASPLIAIIGVKGIRTRSRRTDPNLRSRVTSGWNEYVDAAVDAGLGKPGPRTRLEIAELYSANDPNVVFLAKGADYAAFSSDLVTQVEADNYWLGVGAAKRSLMAGKPVKRMIAARLSLRSVIRKTKAQA